MIRISLRGLNQITKIGLQKKKASSEKILFKLKVNLDRIKDFIQIKYFFK